ncbi:hypothetical protein FQ154_15300 [Paeniglutamicibacter gangotriensis]|uniref:Uncharacterized protein n=1 Tax=Paeniglutamicibacter gangotriensis TaxID=254787 RepID=A0A5B0E6R5_9MICC|nr:hypothetical protein [Paeniglutamicibacter gangotriensis]KAA0974418.1 hypothetical protein FQ154_15300 [Paeniglutamicibacter gangotriensis]
MSLPENNEPSGPRPLINTLRDRRSKEFSTTVKPIKLFDADAYRAVVWILVAMIALFAWFSSSDSTDPKAGKVGMVAAEIIKKSNDSNTEGAPQQQVVNGWYVADALPVISDQIAGVHTTVASNRVPAFAFIFGMGFCVDIVGRSLGGIRNKRVLAAAAERNANAALDPQ